MSYSENTWTIAQELNNAFQLATLRIEAETLTVGRHWRQAGEIIQRADQERRAARDAYLREYDTRVDVARRRIIEKAGSKTKDHVHPQGMRNRFSASDTLRQAQRDVRLAHEQHLQRIDARELHDMQALMIDAARCNNVRGKPREAFKRATDRRSGEDRRDLNGASQARKRSRDRLH